MSDLFGNHIVGFPTRRLICGVQQKTCATEDVIVHSTNQDPVVQSIVSLTISLRHKFVKQISAKVTNTQLFFVEKM